MKIFTYLLAAILTRSEWFDAQMDAHMLRQVGAVGERLDAVGALVGLGLAHMHLRVHVQLSLAVERLQSRPLVTTQRQYPI